MTAWRFLFFSLVAHILIWLLLAKSAEIFQKPKPTAPIEVSIVEPQGKTQQKPKTLAPALPTLKDLKPKDPKYFSEQDQYVEKQTRARNLQLYNPISPSLMGSDQNDPKDKKSSKENSDKENPEEQKQKLAKNDSESGDMATQKDSRGGRKSSSSAASDPLLYEDADVGSITALNAQGMQFYAFTSRIQGPIVNHWTRNLRYFEARWSQKDLERLSNHDWVTVVEAILDEQGHHLKTILVQSSGESEIDSASLSIFKQIGFFPNPPREMVGEDRTIHLKYGFKFHVPAIRQMASPGF